MFAHPNTKEYKRGFTLIETIIYIGLFGLLFAGILGTIFPFFTGAERLTRNIATEGETAFILRKIQYALSDTLTTPSDHVTTPSAGATEAALYLNTDAYAFYHTGNQLFIKKGTDPAFPLNAERVPITNFSVTHVAPLSGAPRYLEISFTANGQAVGPVRYYLHF